jgi:hypothetical protein
MTFDAVDGAYDPLHSSGVGSDVHVTVSCRTSLPIMVQVCAEQPVAEARRRCAVKAR